ncbi:Ig-like domain-containing protein [Terribacillus saccharophilus]|uniref:Ig-like domain-containing protein n=1 Tax=Terribacillus saccharophilus TaxID=361277 RepID=UPI0039827B65
MSKRKDYDHKKNMQRKNKMRMAKRSSALIAAAAIVVTPYVYDSEQKTLSKYTAEAADIAVLGNQSLRASYSGGVLTLTLRGNQLANVGVLNNYSPNFQLPEELSSLLQNPNIRSQTSISYSIPYAGIGGIALNNTGTVSGSRLTFNTATNSFGTNIQHTLGIAVSSPTTFTARINLANLGITELPTAPDGRLDFRAVATDTLLANVDLLNSRGGSASITTGVSDTQPPSAPVLNSIDSDDTTLSGTAEANSRINISLPDGSTATATTDANGNWSATIPAQRSGGTISATATDAAGNRSSAGTVTVTNSDTEPPAAPVIDPVNSNDTTISGTAEAGTSITLTLGDGSTVEAVTDEAGNWSAEIPAQAADSTITAVATDEAGNDSETSSVTVTNGDTEAPAAPEISPVDSDDTTLTGTAEAGAAITITLGDGTVIETEADENGNWTAEIPTQDPDSDISVTATDAAGNQSSPGTVTVTNAGGGADTEPPEAPVIAPVTDEDTTLSGTAEANADIIVTLPDGNTAETTADSDGNWTVDIPAQAANSEIAAVAVDEAGNESESGTVTVTDADSDAPAAPEINPVDSDDTSLSGTAEANAEIVVTLPDGTTAETTADADGNWTVDIPTQAADSEISAIAVDEAGNESDAGSITVTDADSDVEAPAAPGINPVDSDDTSLSGTAEPNADIIITLPDGTTAETTADAGGNWTVDIAAQDPGSEITAIAIDDAGNESDASSIEVSNADTEAPAVPEVNDVNNDDTSLSGTAEANATITVLLPDGSEVETTADADGNWTVDIPAQETGSVISVTATDEAGNESDAGSVTVTNADTEAPVAPEVDPVDSDDTSISGTAEPNSDIELTFSDGTKVETRTDADGNWTVEIPPQEPGSEISVVAIDDAGNRSNASTVVVINYDSTPPPAPEIDPVNSNDTSLSGTAEPNAALVISLPDGSTVNATADADGNWTTDIPAQEPGGEISAIAIDEAGNQSGAGTVTVTNADTTAPDAPTADPVDSDDTTFSGTAEANADIIVTLPDGTAVRTTADADGNWSVDIPAQDPGAILSVVAVDEARNISPSNTINVTNADTTAPDVPEINPVDSDDTALSGTAEANADIIVTLPDGSTLTTRADNDGNWSVDIPAQNPGAVLSVVAVDDARNISGAGTVNVTNADVTAPDAPEINPVDSDATALSGTAEANTDIIVTLSDGSTVSTTADADGNWSVDIPTQDPGAVLSAVAVDEARNISDAGTVNVTNADVTAPDAPEINPADSDDTTLSGSAEANANVVITLPDGSTLTITADSDGNWTVDIPVQDPGAVLSAVAVDDARNTSSASTVTITNADTTAPDAPEINPVDSDDTTLSGTAEANADVIVTLPDGSTLTATADADGNWTVDIPAQNPDAVLSVVAVDDASNISSASTINVTNADTTAPDAPEINPIDSGDTTLSGTAEANADVVITLPDGSTLTTTADSDGSWTVDIPAQNPGAILSVVAVDEARNISDASTVNVTNADTTAPDAPEINPADSDDTALSGTAEVNADIIVTLPDGTILNGTADADGNWSVDIPAQNPGAALSVVAVDEARNISDASTINVTNADTTAPDAPEINPVDSEDTILSGTAEANADIIITLPDGTTISTTADAEGNWTADIPVQDPGAILSVAAIDAARNVSERNTVSVTNADTTAPDAPEINPADSDDTTLSGTAEANANIVITLPDGSTLNTTADADGNWTVDIPAQNPGAILSVVAVDDAQNVSDSSNATVTNADTTAPDAPEINPADSDDTALSGTAEPNANIIVTLPDGTSIRTTADADGSWTVDIPAQNPGAVLSVVAVDDAQNVSDSSNVTVTNADTTAPDAPEINPADSDDTVLSGTAEANATIIVTLPDGSTLNTTADADGNWTIDIPVQDPGTVLSVAAVDDAQNVSDSNTVTVTNADTTAPDAPEINPADSDDTALSGSAEANADIIVTLPDGTSVQTTADADGNWTVDIPVQNPGAVLAVVAVDEARNVSGANTITITNADTTAPDAPEVNPADSDDTVLSGTAEANANVIITLPDGSTLNTTADADGRWTVDIPAQNPGAVLSVAAVDDAQNVSASSAITVTNADTTAPDAPEINPADSDDTVLSGTAEANANVIVTLPDGTTLNTTADADGNWTVDIPVQDPGVVLSAVAVDDAQNVSNSNTITITNADTTAPDAPEINPADSDDTVLSGTAEPDANIIVTLPDGTSVRTTADADGNWSVDVPAQDPGAALSVVAVDAARNVSDANEITVTNADTTAPDAPEVNPADSDDTSLSGTAEADANIIVTLPDGSTIRTTADEQGNWIVDIPAQNPGAVLSATAIDEAGNISGANTVTVTNADTTAPGAPEVNPVASDDTTLSGTAEANADVIVTLPDGSTINTTADEQGNWSVSIPNLNTGDTVSVVAVDEARNISDPGSVTVEAGALENPAPPTVGAVSDNDNFIFGIAGINSYISLYFADGTVIETRADDQGQWSAEIPPQPAGSEISIIETDENGNSSEPTVITVADETDTEAPATPIALPVSNTDTALSGIAEPETTVVVTLPDGTQLETVTDENGNWSIAIPLQEAGQELSIVSVDAAGNQSEAQVVSVADNIQPELPSVNPVTDADTALSGEAEPNATVVITLPDGSTVDAPVDENGNWQATIPAQDPGDEITVVVTDPAGNISNPAVIPVENSDTDAPEAAIVNPVTDADTTLSGEAEPNATVVITMPDGTAVQAPVDEDGNWQAAIPAQETGDEITVVVTDPAGNSSNPVVIPVENSDNTAPDAPVVDTVNDADTTLSGEAEPNATVIVTLPDGTAVQAPVDENGNWQATIPAQAPGDEITVVVTDPAGNSSNPVVIPVENSDNTAPDAPVVDTVNDADTTLSGEAEPSATVVITLPDGSNVQAFVDEDGNWQATIPAQTPGSTINVVVTDAAGNISDPTVISVENSDTDAPVAAIVDPVTDADTTLSGEAEPNAIVVVTLPDGSSVQASVDDNGSWQADIPAQAPGSTINVVVTDAAGNVSDPTVVSVENSDTEAPEAAIVDPVTDADTTLSGEAEPNATVVITLPDATAVQASVDEDGNWQATIPAQEPGTEILVSVTDAAGNVSDPTVVPVGNSDTEAPDTPVVNPVTDADTTLSGEAEPNATVVVTLPDGTAVQASVDDNGSWQADIPAQEPGSLITVVVTDTAGNVSAPTVVSVENSDTEAPVAPAVDPVTDADTTLSGEAEPDATVVVTLPDGSTVDVPVDEDGNWQADIPAQEPGTEIIVVVTDPAGNISDPAVIPVENSDMEAPGTPVVNPVTDVDTTLSGEAEPNATVVITLPDGSAVQVPVDADGNWQADIPAQEPGSTINVVVTDQAGNTSTPAIITVENSDTEAPDAPAVNPVNDADTTLSGEAEPDATVVITLPDGSAVQAPVDADGNWQADIPAQEPGTEIIVVVTDPAGNISDSTIVPVENSDTDAPDVPIVNPVSDEDTTLSGEAEPGASVVITLPGGSTIETPVDADGNWQADVPAQEPGEEIAIVVIDPDGNVSNPVIVPVQNSDTDAPDVPTVNPVSNDDTSLSGEAEPDATVVITLPDGSTVEAPVDADGNWQTDIPAQEPGDDITVVVTDPAGNVSNPVIIPVDNSDTGAPDVPTVNPITDEDTTLSGEAEPDATVVITLPDGSTVDASVDEDGNWQADIPAQEPGEVITVVVTDPAGNISDPVIIPVENSDTDAPDVPTVNPVTDEDTTLSGEAEPNATVVITLPDGSTVEASVGENGNWQADIPAQEPGNDITVVVIDAAGNVSAPGIVSVADSDTEAPAAPVVDPITDADTTLSGEAEPDATVVITLPDGSTVEAPVDEDGNWEADIPAQESGEVITVVVTDPAGNIGSPVIVPVDNSDTLAPDIPVVDSVTDADTTLSGEAEPNATVVITLPDSSVIDAPVDEDGNWEADIPAQEPGEQIIVVVRDSAGNISNPAVVPVGDSDIVTPDVPIVDPITEDDDTISGDGEPGSTVVITLPGGDTIETPVGDDGTWETDIPAQEPGEEVIVVIIDPENGVSDPVIVPVEDGESDTPAPPTVDPITEDDETISGDGEPGSTVVITLPGGDTIETPVGDDGTWETEIPAQEPGEEVVVVITDPEGNESDPVTIPVEDGESDTPAPPTVDPIDEGGDIISGGGQPGGTIIITLPGGETVEVPVDENGNWSVPVPGLETGDEISVIGKDPEGNESTPIKAIVGYNDEEAASNGSDGSRNDAAVALPNGSANDSYGGSQLPQTSNNFLTSILVSAGALFAGAASLIASRFRKKKQ